MKKQSWKDLDTLLAARKKLAEQIARSQIALSELDAKIEELRKNAIEEDDDHDDNDSDDGERRFEPKNIQSDSPPYKHENRRRRFNAERTPNSVHYCSRRDVSPKPR